MSNDEHVAEFINGSSSISNACRGLEKRDGDHARVPAVAGPVGFFGVVWLVVLHEQVVKVGSPGGENSVLQSEQVSEIKSDMLRLVGRTCTAALKLHARTRRAAGAGTHMPVSRDPHM